MTPHDEYDPELHGMAERTAPAAAHGTALTVSLVTALLIAMFLVWLF